MRKQLYEQCMILYGKTQCSIFRKRKAISGTGNIGFCMSVIWMVFIWSQNVLFVCDLSTYMYIFCWCDKIVVRYRKCLVFGIWSNWCVQRCVQRMYQLWTPIHQLMYSIYHFCIITSAHINLPCSVRKSQASIIYNTGVFFLICMPFVSFTCSIAWPSRR